MLTIFWSLTLGPDEPIPLFWRNQQHPCNLPPLLSSEQLEKIRYEQRARQEATSRARREVRRVLGLSRNRNLTSTYQPDQMETLDTLLLYHLLSYPYRALRLRYYAAPYQWHADRLHSPVAYLMTLERTRQQSGIIRWWQGSTTKLAHYGITKGTTFIAKYLSKESRSSSTTRTTTLASIGRWIRDASIELMGYIVAFPFYRAFIFQSVLITINTTQLAPTIQMELNRHSSILGQWRLWWQSIRQPTSYTSMLYWQRAFPVSLLYHALSTRLVDWLMQQARPHTEQAEAHIVASTPLSSTTANALASTALSSSSLLELAETSSSSSSASSSSSDIINRRRRRLWRSCAWSATHLSAILLTRIILTPLEALSTRLVLAGSPLEYSLTSRYSHGSSNVIAGISEILHLTVQSASWSGLICECLLAIIVAQVDWLVCRQVIRWQSASYSQHHIRSE
ncbi:hypothetical protein BDF22DRAFT_703437 [Syncephalis plumigaleata]|nr:hypothetical protein BDF22DRAFT_703437 [Syncephalis plumigaleata]